MRTIQKGKSPEEPCGKECKQCKRLPRCSRLDIVDNVIPYISSEEDRLENEATRFSVA
jgi:hypothetical protein